MDVSANQLITFKPTNFIIVLVYQCVTMILFDYALKFNQFSLILTIENIIKGIGDL